jgi:hypothetical protein
MSNSAASSFNMYFLAQVTIDYNSQEIGTFYFNYFPIIH